MELQQVQPSLPLYCHVGLLANSPCKVLQQRKHLAFLEPKWYLAGSLLYPHLLNFCLSYERAQKLCLGKDGVNSSRLKKSLFI